MGEIIEPIIRTNTIFLKRLKAIKQSNLMSPEIKDDLTQYSAPKKKN